MEVRNHAFDQVRAQLKPSFSDEIKGGYMIFVIFGGPRKWIQKLVQIWSKTGPKLAKSWPETGQNLARNQPETGQKLARIWPEIDQKVTKIASKWCQKARQKAIKSGAFAGRPKSRIGGFSSAARHEKRRRARWFVGSRPCASSLSICCIQCRNFSCEAFVRLLRQRFFAAEFHRCGGHEIHFVESNAGQR